MKKNLSNIQVILIIGSTIKILGLIYKILLTRILEIEGMRIMSLIFPTLSLVLCLSSLSISTVVNQNVAAKLNKSKTILRSAFNITFVSSSIISIALLLSFPLYKIIYQNSFIYYPLLVCIPLVYLSNTSGILKGYLEANNNFKVTYISNFFEQLTKFILTFVLLIIFKEKTIEFKIIMCFLALMLSEVASFSYLVIKVKKKHKFKSIRVKTNGYEKSILKQAVPLTLDQLIMTITGYFEPLIFYYAIGLNGTDIYEASIYYTKVTSYAIPLLIFAHFGVLSIAKYAFPQITKYKDSNKIMDIISKSTFICVIIAAFNLIVCTFYAKETLELMYGDCSSYEIAKKLAFFYFFSYFNPILIIILQAYKKEKKLLLCSFITSIVSLILIFVLTYFYSYKGFLLSIIISNVVKFLLLLIFANTCCPLNFKFRRAIPLLLIIVSYFLLNYYFTSFLCLAISTVVGALLALLLYYFFYKRNKDYHGIKMHK